MLCLSRCTIYVYLQPDAMLLLSNAVQDGNLILSRVVREYRQPEQRHHLYIKRMLTVIQHPLTKRVVQMRHASRLTCASSHHHVVGVIFCLPSLRHCLQGHLTDVNEGRAPGWLNSLIHSIFTMSSVPIFRIFSSQVCLKGTHSLWDKL